MSVAVGGLLTLIVVCAHDGTRIFGQWLERRHRERMANIEMQTQKNMQDAMNVANELHLELIKTQLRREEIAKI